MSVFSKLFQTRKNEEIHDQENFDIMENLFVDNQKPIEVESGFATETSGIQQFLNQNFYSKGYEDGYRNHSEESLEFAIKGIKAEFRFKIDQLIDQKRKNKLVLMNLQVETGTIAESLNIQANNILNDLDESIQVLKKEKESSAMDEGWVMKAVHLYHEGFTEGTRKYQEERLLGLSTGFFN